MQATATHQGSRLRLGVYIIAEGSLPGRWFARKKFTARIHIPYPDMRMNITASSRANQRAGRQLGADSLARRRETLPAEISGSPQTSQSFLHACKPYLLVRQKRPIVRNTTTAARDSTAPQEDVSLTRRRITRAKAVATIRTIARKRATRTLGNSCSSDSRPVMCWYGTYM